MSEMHLPAIVVVSVDVQDLLALDTQHTYTRLAAIARDLENRRSKLK